MGTADVEAALKEALDLIDNFQALNRLTPRQLAVWEQVRQGVFAAMGGMIAIRVLDPLEPVE